MLPVPVEFPGPKHCCGGIGGWSMAEDDAAAPATLYPPCSGGTRWPSNIIIAAIGEGGQYCRRLRLLRCRRQLTLNIGPRPFPDVGVRTKTQRPSAAGAATEEGAVE